MALFGIKMITVIFLKHASWMYYRCYYLSVVLLLLACQWHMSHVIRKPVDAICEQQMPYANNKGADQAAHPRSLISAFIVHCLVSRIPLLAIAEISRL